jgi:hypothetical protein
MKRSNTDREALFWQLAEELQREDSRVREGTIMNGRCLRVGDEFLALVDYKDSGLVVKLSKRRVAELIDEGVGKPFAPAGRVFKEWVSVPTLDRERWLELLRERHRKAHALAKRSQYREAHGEGPARK